MSKAILEIDTPLNCYKCIHNDVCSGRFDVEEYGIKCEGYKEADDRVNKIIDKLRELQLRFEIIMKNKRLYLNVSGFEHFIDLLIDWIKTL